MAQADLLAKQSISAWQCRGNAFCMHVVRCYTALYVAHIPSLSADISASYSPVSLAAFCQLASCIIANADFMSIYCYINFDDGPHLFAPFSERCLPALSDRCISRRFAGIQKRLDSTTRIRAIQQTLSFPQFSRKALLHRHRGLGHAALSRRQRRR